MTYRPISDLKIHELVSVLYLERWVSSISKIEQLVAVSDAREICELLVSSEGWRERVVAAKIIAAFAFVDLVTPLISTFNGRAESYTVRAFAKLIITTATPDIRHKLLEELRACCPDTPYGRHMIKVIDDTSGSA
jgi:hypothetical protein